MTIYLMYGSIFLNAVLLATTAFYAFRFGKISKEVGYQKERIKSQEKLINQLGKQNEIKKDISNLSNDDIDKRLSKWTSNE